MQNSIRRVLIANRGEVCSRIARTLKKLSMTSIAIRYKGEISPHTNICDESIELDQSGLQAYLNIDAIVAAAKKMNCDAIHPGWGFLSENPEFAAAIESAGLCFIGPTPEQMKQLGDKFQAKALAQKLGVPVVSFVSEKNLSKEKFFQEVSSLSFPVLLKPVAGGGGKGMVLVENAQELPTKYEQARREAQSAFGDPSLLAEPYLNHPRHVEVQIVGDGQGGAWHLGERDCTIQRRHQKMIEESPSSFLSQTQKEKIFEYALRLASHVSYRNVGTVEFIVDHKGNPYFMEVNTRLQVEHGVTEELLELDLVELQMKVAAEEPIATCVPKYQPKKHVIQVRVYSESPYTNFLPSTGKILQLALPEKDCRIDHALEQGSVIDASFDPMLMKLIVEGKDRAAAIVRLKHALSHTIVLGVQTNLNYFQWICNHEAFQQAKHHTQWVAQTLPEFQAWEDRLDLTIVAALLKQETTFISEKSSEHSEEDRCLVWDEIKTGSQEQGGSMQAWYFHQRKIELAKREKQSAMPAGARIVRDKNVCWIWVNGLHFRLEKKQNVSFGEASKEIFAPMTAKVVSAQCSAGSAVKQGDTLMVLSAMKMEYVVKSTMDGRVKEISCKPGDQVEQSQILVRLE